MAGSVAGVSGARIRVAGYTDRLGGAAYNRSLSQARADAVRQYLIERGISGGQIEAVGLGASEPVADCAGVRPRQALIACLAPNRRVVIDTVVLEPGA